MATRSDSGGAKETLPAWVLEQGANMQELKRLREQIRQCEDGGDEATAARLTKEMYAFMRLHGLGEEGVRPEEVE